MTQEGWKHVIKHANTNEDSLNLLSQLLAEQDKAKARLSAIYACAGRPWPDLVDDILDCRLRGVTR